MKLAGKVILATFALVIATVMSSTIVSHLPLRPPGYAPPSSQILMFPSMLLGCFVLVLGTVPLASGLGGRVLHRWLTLFGLIYLATGVNTVLELSIFSTIGGAAYLVVMYFLCFLVPAAILAWSFGSQDAVSTPRDWSVASWMGRLVLAWVSFPVIYFVFGMCIAPIVVPVYNAGVAGLVIPPITTIVPMQLLRSLVFLGASLPVIMLWTGSRRGLILALGLAHTVLVGLYGLSQATELPMVLRVAHSIEITADSFAYAFVLGVLFFPRARSVSVHAANAPAAA